MMVAMSDTDPRAAFVIAGVVLLVMPFIYMMGLAGAMLMAQFAPVDNARGFMLAFAVVWGLVVVAAVLLVARRLSRSARTDG
jgi:hypothetical protein